jgi:hypothetical protein
LFPVFRSDFGRGLRTRVLDFFKVKKVGRIVLL